MKKIAIIGAGISGLVLANKLNSSYDVTVYDKSRGIGGRLATRYADEYQFDHGAQYFTAKTKSFQGFVKYLQENKVVDTWNAKFVEIEGGKIKKQCGWNDKYPHYVGVPKMNAIGKFLAKDLNIKLSCPVGDIIRYENKWQVFDNEGAFQDSYDYIVLAIPPHQANNLLYDIVEFKEDIISYKMQGCFSLMLGYENDIGLDFDAALVKDSVLSWVAINSSKAGRPDGFSVLINSTNDWAEENIESDIDTVKDTMLKEAEKILGSKVKQFNHCNIHRWRYANIKKQNGPLFLENKDNQIAAIGDWLIQGRVESAYISAMALYEQSFKE
jgi:renalase